MCSGSKSWMTRSHLLSLLWSTLRSRNSEYARSCSLSFTTEARVYAMSPRLKCGQNSCRFRRLRGLYCHHPRKSLSLRPWWRRVPPSRWVLLWPREHHLEWQGPCSCLWGRRAEGSWLVKGFAKISRKTCFPSISSTAPTAAALSASSLASAVPKVWCNSFPSKLSTSAAKDGSISARSTESSNLCMSTASLFCNWTTPRTCSVRSSANKRSASSVCPLSTTLLFLWYPLKTLSPYPYKASMLQCWLLSLGFMKTKPSTALLAQYWANTKGCHLCPPFWTSICI